MIFIKILISQTIVIHSEIQLAKSEKKEIGNDEASLEYTNEYTIDQFWTKPFILIESHGLSA